MPRKIKRESGIYQYLDKLGILEHGSSIEINEAKKKYWAVFRKKWKQEHRHNDKSFTISFNAREYHLLIKRAKAANCSTNRYIKNACMSVLLDTPNVDKKIIGKIRELLMLFHSHLQSLSDKSSCNIHDVIHEFSIIEINILSLLIHTKSLDDVD